MITCPASGQPSSPGAGPGGWAAPGEEGTGEDDEGVAVEDADGAGDPPDGEEPDAEEEGADVPAGEGLVDPAGLAEPVRVVAGSAGAAGLAGAGPAGPGKAGMLARGESNHMSPGTVRQASMKTPTAR